MDTEDKKKRVEELHKELFELANSFAGEDTGHVAVFLHHAANHVLYAKRALEGHPDVFTHKFVGVDVGTGESENREMVVDEVFKEPIAGCDRCRKKDADWYSALMNKI